jgi:hypothetical protein
MLFSKNFEDASAHYRALSRAGRNEPENGMHFFMFQVANGTSTASSYLLNCITYSSIIIKGH